MTVKKAIERTIPNQIRLCSEIIDKREKTFAMQLPKSELVIKAQQLKHSGLSAAKIAQELAVSESTVIRYLKIPDNKLKQYQIQEAMKLPEKTGFHKRQERMKAIRSLSAKGIPQREIARQLSIAVGTVRRYLRDETAAIHKSCGIKRTSKLSGYYEIINKLALQGIPAAKICQQIKEQGYTGSISILKEHIQWLKQQQDTAKSGSLKNKDYILRQNLISLLYHDIPKVDAITREQFNRVIKQYKMLPLIYGALKSFRNILSNRKPEQLNRWIEGVEKMRIPELTHFLSGIKRDLDAVKNAIRYSYSNGKAEGCVNKIKVIKRIMYGRCSFQLLKNKVLLSY